MTRRSPDSISTPARDGAYIHGLTLEGAAWDDRAGCLADAEPKQLSCSMPALHIRVRDVRVGGGGGKMRGRVCLRRARPSRAMCCGTP